MNWSHLRATVWLRWRILANRIKRTGKLGNLLFVVLVVIALCGSVGAFALALLLGLEKLPDAEPLHVMFVWIALALAFVFFWMIGLMTDLQRSDAMSFKNLLHLPVSLVWVFLYNYISSYVSLSVALFLPAMLGLCLASVIVDGPLMLLTIPLVFGYFGMITALTYQLRGWLARLMENKRRGRSIIAAVTVCFVILVQTPNLIHLSRGGLSREERRRDRNELRELRQTSREEGPKQAAAKAEIVRRKALEVQKERELERNISLATMLIPLGWLPYGARANLEGRLLPTGLCAMGLLLVAAWSLRRSYRTTMGPIVGAVSVGESAQPAGPTSTPARGMEGDVKTRERTPLVERSLPIVSEQASGVALACMRSLMRAPEVKMLLLSPMILLGLFCFMLANNPIAEKMPALVPMISLGAIMMGLLSIIQLIQNQFGLDRAGFRAFVLSPVPREQILLGKNLAIAPLGIGIGLVALIAAQFFVPVDTTHFLGGCLQLLSAFLLLCIVGNHISITGPMRLKENALKAANAKLKLILLQLVLVLLIPVTLSPLMIPALAEFFLRGQSWARAIPLFLALHAIFLAGIFLLYRRTLRGQGELLQDREQRILDVLTHD